MNVLIIEDETPAAEKIARYLQKYDSGIRILATLQSVEDSVSWLQSNTQPLDLILSDIQLTDGLSFEIFQKVDVSTPVIFTTAYDEYALDAFKMNSVGYLLKPVTFLDLSNAIRKIDSLKAGLNTSNVVSKVAEDVQTKSYKKRFLVKVGEHINSVKSSDISLFFADGRTVYLVNTDGKKFIVDFKMENLEELLNPKEFFRANRSFILNINGIRDVLVYSNSRLKITLHLPFEKDIIVSRERVGEFKNWFDGQG